MLLGWRGLARSVAVERIGLGRCRRAAVVPNQNLNLPTRDRGSKSSHSGVRRAGSSCWNQTGVLLLSCCRNQAWAWQPELLPCDAIANGRPPNERCSTEVSGHGFQPQHAPVTTRLGLWSRRSLGSGTCGYPVTAPPGTTTSWKKIGRLSPLLFLTTAFILESRSKTFTACSGPMDLSRAQ